jgi:hypothetical protein
MGNLCPIEDSKQELYHGSPVDVKGKFLEARPSNVLSGEKAVFATADRALALTFMSRWGDEDFDLGYINGQLTMEEKRQGAFLEIFAGKSAYLYHVSSRGFKHDDRLMPAEQIRKSKTRIIEKEYIDDVWDEIVQAGERKDIELIYFNDTN